MAIEVGEEKECVVYDFPVQISGNDRTVLLNYAMDSITTEEMDELLLEWVMLKIIRENVEATLNQEESEDK